MYSFYTHDNNGYDMVICRSLLLSRVLPWTQLTLPCCLVLFCLFIYFYCWCGRIPCGFAQTAHGTNCFALLFFFPVIHVGALTVQCVAAQHLLSSACVTQLISRATFLPPPPSRSVKPPLLSSKTSDRFYFTFFGSCSVPLSRSLFLLGASGMRTA